MNAMQRLVPITLNEVEYYLNCGLGCMSDLESRFGGLESALGAAEDDGGPQAEAIKALLYLMLRDGTDYMREIRCETEFPGLSEKQVGLLIGLDDLEELMPKIKLAINGGRERTVEVKPDPKNAKATGGKRASRGTTTTQKGSG